MCGTEEGRRTEDKLLHYEGGIFYIREFLLYLVKNSTQKKSIQRYRVEVDWTTNVTILMLVQLEIEVSS